MEAIGCAPMGAAVQPSKRRSKAVRRLRRALEEWTNDTDRVRKNTVDLSSAVQKAARLEAAIVPEGDQAAAEKQEQVAALLAAAEAIIADQELREFMTERNRAALDASLLLFGNKGVIKVPPGSAAAAVEGAPLAVGDAWRPRWPGDQGDAFEPYQQLIEQYLHSTVAYHARALEQLSTAFAALRTASQGARDGAYLRSLAAAAGVSVKEYKRFLDMFHKIDTARSGAISKKDLMAAMKKDKDIAAFMQLSRQKGKDGKRESFEAVFNRIDADGAGKITWEAFLKFFSDQRSLAAD
ncbi:hypothetical protein KFL_002220010 [Klebsormidium nitens]|uniref:EF-hand domain-containing protein n=1 Tax=Klebsormidium nitens TaxID=105231 RepID=A0A1Y1I8Y0_KLENI|nr:hypothetical protein KFL_002220010 [Klebsormidium nitens]|eukprot:GAQ85157.1 hypothetical protein KFL_002220010 [Klebsormidium nitens]